MTNRQSSSSSSLKKRSVCSLLRKEVQPPGNVRFSRQWEWLAGCDTSTFVDSDQDVGNLGLLGAFVAAANRGWYLRTTPDDWWRLLAARANSVMAKFRHALLVTDWANSSLKLPLGDAKQISLERIRAAIAEQQFDLKV